MTVRVKHSRNYEVPPHYHPHAEHGTLSGTYYLRLGDKFERKDANVLKAGDLFVIPVYTPTIWVGRRKKGPNFSST